MYAYHDFFTHKKQKRIILLYTGKSIRICLNKVPKFRSNAPFADIDSSLHIVFFTVATFVLFSSFVCVEIAHAKLLSKWIVCSLSTRIYRFFFSTSSCSSEWHHIYFHIDFCHFFPFYLTAALTNSYLSSTTNSNLSFYCSIAKRISFLVVRFVRFYFCICMLRTVTVNRICKSEKHAH